MSGGVELKVKGTAEFEAVKARLKQAADRGLNRELSQALNRATKPLKAAAKANALSDLPKRGGLAAAVAASKFSTRTRTGKDPSVRIEVKGLSVSNLRALDRGTLRHPTFGHRDRWVTQQVHVDWFTAPMQAGAEPVRRELSQALDTIAQRIGG